MSPARRLAALILAAAISLAIAAPSVAQSGPTFKMHPRDLFVVRLPANASTGYHWTITHSPNRGRVVSSQYVEPPAGSPPGASGHQLVKVRALRIGRTRIELAYVAPDGTTVGARYRALLVITKRP